MTTFLKFPDESTAKTVLSTYVSADGDWITDSHTHSLDPIGVIYQPTGNMLTDENGVEYSEMAAIAGYHINFLGDLPAIPSAYIVHPTTPARIFAGVSATPPPN